MVDNLLVFSINVLVDEKEYTSLIINVINMHPVCQMLQCVLKLILKR